MKLAVEVGQVGVFFQDDVGDEVKERLCAVSGFGLQQLKQNGEKADLKSPVNAGTDLQTKAPHQVQTLQPETVGCSPLTAVHVVTEGKNNLKGNKQDESQSLLRSYMHILILPDLLPRSFSV